ncbi:MAG: bifunctional ADP-heptose synthase, partial [Bacteroidia bacterium]|nr:bifunctional ADP-heptose synthase [Bacteroidia bacterium]
VWGRVSRLSPEAPVPIVNVQKKEMRLGGAANVALNVQALGANPILCSVIGADMEGMAFLELLKKQRLSQKGILKSRNRPTTIKTRIIGNNHQLLRVDEESEEDILPNETQNLLTLINYIIHHDKIDVIIFEDYNKGLITSKLIQKVVELARQKNIPVCVDPKKRNFHAYKHVTLFKPNLKELKDGLKIEDVEEMSLHELQRTVSSYRVKQKINTILVTLADKGVIINTRTDKHHIPAHVRKIADVSGAGDTVISVAALCEAMQCEPYLTASLANLAGGLVCEEVGVVPIDKSKFLEEAMNLDFVK